jgi:hypothetical protein
LARFWQKLARKLPVAIAYVERSSQSSVLTTTTITDLMDFVREALLAHFMHRADLELTVW